MLTSHPVAPCFCILSASIAAYFVGCSIMKAAPKQAEKVACGSLTPSSVPATWSPRVVEGVFVSSTETGRPGGGHYAVAVHTYQCCVATDEVVHGLRQVELAHRREHTKCIARQEDDVLRLRPDARYLRIGNVLDRVGSPRVLCNDSPSVISRRASKRFLLGEPGG